MVEKLVRAFICAAMAVASPAYAAAVISFEGTSSGTDNAGLFLPAGTSWQDAAATFTIIVDDEAISQNPWADGGPYGYALIDTFKPHVTAIFTLGDKSLTFHPGYTRLVTGFWGDQNSEMLFGYSFMLDPGDDAYFSVSLRRPYDGSTMPRSFLDPAIVEQPLNYIYSGSLGFGIGDASPLVGGTMTVSRATIGAVVPEPSTWLMMIVGFGVAGLAMRAQRRRPIPS